MNESRTPRTKVDLQDQAIRGISWTLVHTVVSLPLSFVANLVTARVLGVSDYGRLAFLMTFMDVAGGIVSLGLGIGLLQFGARAHAAGRFGEVQHLLSVSQGFRLLVVAPLLSVAVVLVAHVELQILVVALLFGIWIPAALDGALFCVTIEGRSDLGAKVAIVRNVLTQAAVISAALIFATADAAWSCRLMADGVMMFVYVGCISPRYRRAVLRARFPRGFPSGFWRFALPAGFAAVVGTLALSRTEVFFLSWLSTPESVGLFALAFGLATHVFAPADALVGPLVPAVSGLNEVDSDALAPAFERVLRASATASGLACSVVLPALAVLVPFLYGSEFKNAAPMLLVLGMAAAVLVIGGPVSVFTLGRLSGRLLVSANLVALAVDVALALCLIPVLGAWGAVAANAAGALTRFAILAVSELRALGLHVGALGNQVLPAVAAIPIAFAVYFAADRIDAPAVLRSLLAAVVGLALLTLTMKVGRTGLTAGDRIVIARAVPAPVRGAVRASLWMVVGRASDAANPGIRTSE